MVKFANLLLLYSVCHQVGLEMLTDIYCAVNILRICCITETLEHEGIVVGVTVIQGTTFVRAIAWAMRHLMHFTTHYTGLYLFSILRLYSGAPAARRTSLP